MDLKKIFDKILHESYSRNDSDAEAIIDYIEECILDYDFYFEGGDGMLKMKKDIQEMVNELRNEFFYLDDTDFDSLGSEPLSKLEDLASRLYTLASMQGDSGDKKYVKGLADIIKNQVTEAKAELLNRDYQNGRDPEPEDNEPKYGIYCTYYDDGNGETDGDARYENVSFSDLVDTVNKIKDKFLNNELKGSYTWSPIDRNIWDEAGEAIEDIEGISKSEWEKAEDKDDCEINRLKINIYPTYGSEDDFVVIIDGDGEIVKDTLN